MLLLNRLKNTYLETHRVNQSWDCRNGKVIPVSRLVSCLISINSVISAVIMTNICAWVVNTRAIRKHLNICCDPRCFCNKNLNWLRACICARESCNYLTPADLVSFKQNGRFRNERTSVFPNVSFQDIGGDRAADHLTHRQLEVHDCLSTRHCSYCRSSAKASTQKYPQCWLTFHYIGPIWYRNITVIGNIINW